MTPRTDWGNATAAVIEGLRKARIESQKKMELPGAANGDSVCLQGYTSIKCAVCAEGYGKTGDDCVDCTPAHQSALDWCDWPRRTHRPTGATDMYMRIHRPNGATGLREPTARLVRPA